MELFLHLNLTNDGTLTVRSLSRVNFICDFLYENYIENLVINVYYVFILQPAMLKLPIHFARAVSSFLSTKDFVSVKDLELEEDDDKLHLATVLFADDLVEIKS